MTLSTGAMMIRAALALLAPARGPGTRARGRRGSSRSARRRGLGPRPDLFPTGPARHTSTPFRRLRRYVFGDFSGRPVERRAVRAASFAAFQSVALSGRVDYAVSFPVPSDLASGPFDRRAVSCLAVGVDHAPGGGRAHAFLAQLQQPLGPRLAHLFVHYRHGYFRGLRRLGLAETLLERLSRTSCAAPGYFLMKLLAVRCAWMRALFGSTVDPGSATLQQLSRGMRITQ